MCVRLQDICFFKISLLSFSYGSLLSFRDCKVGNVPTIGWRGKNKKEKSAPKGKIKFVDVDGSPLIDLTVCIKCEELFFITFIPCPCAHIAHVLDDCCLFFVNYFHEQLEDIQFV